MSMTENPNMESEMEQETEAPEKKRFHLKLKKPKKKWVIGGIAAVLIAVVILPKFFAPAPRPAVTVREAVKGDILQNVESSGVIQSDQETTYFSPVSATVAQCSLKVGETVRAGDVLLAYDAEDLENQRKQAALTGQAGSSGYQDAITRDNKNVSEYNRSGHDIEILEKQVDDWGDSVDHLNSRITEYSGKQAESAQTLAAKQEILAKASQEQIACQSAYDAAKSASDAAPGDTELAQKTEEAKTALDTVNAQIDTAKADVKKEQDYLKSVNDKLADYQSRLKKTSKELEEFTANLAEQKAIRSSSEAAKLTGAARSQLAANENLNVLNTSIAVGQVDEGKNGIVADYSGIVTSVTAIPGGPAAQGTALFSIASIEKMSVELSLTKYDLEKIAVGQKAEIRAAGRTYTGSIQEISHLAQKNEKGTTVVKARAEIENADENIVLGMEAKVSIQGKEAKGVLVIPTECINTGKEGSFCYIVENGVLVKKMVETGLASDENTEIRSGLNFGDQVVLSGVTADMEEGTAVMITEE